MTCCLPSAVNEGDLMRRNSPEFWLYVSGAVCTLLTAIGFATGIDALKAAIGVWAGIYLIFVVSAVTYAVVSVFRTSRESEAKDTQLDASSTSQSSSSGTSNDTQ